MTFGKHQELFKSHNLIYVTITRPVSQKRPVTHQRHLKAMTVRLTQVTVGGTLREDGQLVAGELGQYERQLVRRLQVSAANLGRRDLLQDVADEEAELSFRNRKRQDGGVIVRSTFGDGRVA